MTAIRDLAPPKPQHSPKPPQPPPKADLTDHPNAAVLSPADTAARLPYPALVRGMANVLGDASVRVPARLVQALPGGASLFVMPANDSRWAMVKLITYTPANVGSTRPAIQGDVVVFDSATGQRALVLDGPTVTARRTAAVSVLAAQQLARQTAGPLLIVGAGVQGLAHLEAFAAVLGVREVWIASRRASSAQALADHAQALGLRARTVSNPDAALADCPLVVTCTPASGVVLSALPRPDAFISAVGAFTPAMVELGPALCRHIAARGQVVLDTPHARLEAGDLLQAGLDVSALPALADRMQTPAQACAGPTLFKSCGWAGWDLAAVRVAIS